MNADTNLWRQAHPNFVQGDTITSEVFRPTPKDAGHLSVYDGDGITAADSHTHYCDTLQLQSASVWAVTKGEADSENTPAAPAPLADNLQHALVDFTGLGSKGLERGAAKKLKQYAVTRGCQYRPQRTT